MAMGPFITWEDGNDHQIIQGVIYTALSAQFRIIGLHFIMTGPLGPLGGLGGVGGFYTKMIIDYVLLSLLSF